MALFKSTIFSQIVNQLAGTVFFYTRYGSIVGRNYVVPTDPNTVAQQTVRTRFSGSMAAWQGMTAAQRDSWEDFAAGTPWQNALGDDVRLTGIAMYLSHRLAALQIDPTIPSATFNDAPCIPGLFPQEFVNIIPCTSGILNVGFQLLIVNNHPTKAIKIGIHISTAQNPSVNFWKGPYDQRSYFTTVSILPTFGVSVPVIGLHNGKRYFMRFRSLNNTDKNLVSSPWHLYADAAFCVS